MCLEGGCVGWRGRGERLKDSGFCNDVDADFHSHARGCYCVVFTVNKCITATQNVAQGCQRACIVKEAKIITSDLKLSLHAWTWDQKDLEAGEGAHTLTFM